MTSHEVRPRRFGRALLGSPAPELGQGPPATDQFPKRDPRTDRSVRLSRRVASALTKAERQKVIPVGDAHPLLGHVMRTPPIMHYYELLLDRAVDISSQTRASLYDCLYVALAEREGCELVTDDQKLIANLKPQFPFIVPLASLP